jgi:hypothetical protein
MLTIKGIDMPKKDEPMTPRRPRFPKIKPKIDRQNAVEAEVVAEEAVQEMKTVTLLVDPNPNGKSSIDLGGLTIPDAIMVLKGFHTYLVNEFNKRMALVNGSEAGTADSTGGSNP